MWTDGLFTVQKWWHPAQSSRLNIIITEFYLVLRVWRELWLHNGGFSVCWWDTHTISLSDISWQQHTETAGRYILREQYCCQVNAVVWFANVSGEGCTYLWIKHNFCLFIWSRFHIYKRHPRYLFIILSLSVTLQSSSHSRRSTRRLVLFFVFFCPE